jgi:hypothetical protein
MNERRGHLPFEIKVLLSVLNGGDKRVCVRMGAETDVRGHLQFIGLPQTPESDLVSNYQIVLMAYIYRFLRRDLSSALLCVCFCRRTFPTHT